MKPVPPGKLALSATNSVTHFRLTTLGRLQLLRGPWRTKCGDSYGTRSVRMAASHGMHHFRISQSIRGAVLHLKPSDPTKSGFFAGSLEALSLFHIQGLFKLFALDRSLYLSLSPVKEYEPNLP